MRLDTSTRTDSTMTTEAMGFDPESTAVLADILSGLYTNPHEAVVREYAANGIDAHEAAGVTHPVEVTLPSGFDPQLVIRDYGTGMSADEARGLFSTYGASNKRTLDDAIGGYGIGSKSAFAISDVLTVETVKNGQKTRLTAVRTEDGPAITGLTTEMTGAASGTLVTIPVDPDQEWDRHAAHALAFTGGSVTIDGEAPEDPRGPDPDGGHPTVAPMVSHLAPFAAEPRVVMGGMSYAIPDSIQEALDKHLTGAVAIIEAPIGTLRLSPSRESILDTKANTELLLNYIHTTWSDEAERTLLGQSAWQTLANVNRSGAKLLPISVGNHIRELANATNYRDERYAAVTVMNDSKRQNIGSRSSFGSATSEVRNTEHERLIFVPWDAKSHPKLRRWLWDHSKEGMNTREWAVAVIAPHADLETIAAAGFAVMDADELSAYKPSAALPKKPKSDIEYPVTDMTGNTDWLTPEEIAERFVKITFGREYNDGFTSNVGYSSSHPDLVACKHTYGDHAGIIQTSLRQTESAAQRRIGLDPVSLQAARTEYVNSQFQALTDEEKRLMVIIYGDRLGSGPHEFGRIPFGVRRRIDERREIIDATRKVVEEYTLDLPDGFEQTATLVTMLTDGEALTSLREKIAASGEDPETWLRTVAPMIHTVAGGVSTWPEETERFIGAVTGIPSHRQRAMIAGYLLIGMEEA